MSSTQWHGFIPYEKGLQLQARLASDLLCPNQELCSHRKTSATILGLEHPKTITLGKRGDLQADLKASPDHLRTLGFEIFCIDRGGQATLHNPGQLVIYPILRLKDFSLTVRRYVDLLLQTSQDVLSDLGILTSLNEAKPGLYTARGKIASVGIRMQRGVSLHGISINVSNDLADFRWIRTCGDHTSTVDRLVDYGHFLSPQDLFGLWTSQWLKMTEGTLASLSSSSVQRPWTHPSCMGDQH